MSELSAAFDTVDAGLLAEEQRNVWESAQSVLADALEAMGRAGGIEQLRAQLPELTRGLSQAIHSYGIAEGAPVYRAHCPMAFESTGADWLQPGTALRNPYFGSMMLECGEITGRLDAPLDGMDHEGHAHE